MPLRRIDSYFKEFEREAVAGRPWRQSQGEARVAFASARRSPWLRVRARLRQLVPWLYVTIRDVPLAFRTCSLLGVTAQMEQRRKRQWLRHLAMHSVTFNGVDAGGRSLDTEEDAWALIKPSAADAFIQHHLGVLDQKNSSLLSLIAIVAAGVGLVVSRTDIEQQPTLLTVTGATILLDLLLCVRASLRVRWGELGHTTRASTAFRLQIEHLIDGLVSRTARFRAATLLTLICVCLVAWYIAGSKVPVPADGRRIPGALVFQETVSFEPGGLCTSPSASSQIARLSGLAQANHWQFVTLEGSADAIPMRHRAAYGNNIGLALARANCVREELERVGQRGQWPMVTVTVRDATNRGDAARRSGDPADRVVQVLVYEATQETATVSR